MGFLSLARQAGIPLVIGSDAHAPEEVGEGFDRAIAAAKDAGYSQLARFKQRERTLTDC